MKAFRGVYPVHLDVLRKAYLDEKDPVERARLKRVWRGAKSKEQRERQKVSQERRHETVNA